MNASADSSSVRGYAWLFWGVALLGFCVDQWSKYGMFSHLDASGAEHDVKIEVIPDVFRFVADYEMPKRKAAGEGLLGQLRTVSGEYLPRVNHGALFGLGGRNKDGRDHNGLFLLVSIAAALAIVFWSTRPLTQGDRLLCLSLGLILAGTLGNLYDRIVFSGVRDFMHWYYYVDWPVFNVADCCLVCGAGLLLVQAFLTEPQAAAQEAQAAKDAAPPDAIQTEVAEAK